MYKKKLNILLADDDIDDCYFIKEALKEFSLPTHLITVLDGEELMELLATETTKLPAILFLDLNMPRKNGFECLSAIRGNEKLNHLPVIIYSTSIHMEIANRLYQNGANYYISKPTDISRLKKNSAGHYYTYSRREYFSTGQTKFCINCREKKLRKAFLV